IVGRRVVPLSRSAPDSGLSRRDPYDVLSRLASRVTSRRDLTLERPNNARVRDKRSLAPPHAYLGPGRSVDSWSPYGGTTRWNRREDRHGPEGRDPPGERGPGEDGRRGRGRGPHRGASVGRRRHAFPGGREGAAADALIQSLLSLPFIKSPRVRPAPAACFFTAIGWTRSFSLIPSCRSNFRTRSSPGVIVPDSSFAITLARSLIFAPRSACFHPRD